MTPDRDELDELLRDDAPAPAMDRVLASLHEELADSPRDRLRGMSTRARRALAVAFVLGAGALGAVTGIRADLHGGDLERVLASCVVLVGVGCLLAAASLRSLAAPPTRAAGLAWLGLVAPIVLVHVPGWWGRGGSTEGWEPCLTAGLAVATFAAGGTLLLERSDRVPGWRIVAASGAGGLLAFAVLGAHCPSSDPTHLLLGHAVEGVLVGLAAWGIDRAVVAARRR